MGENEQGGMLRVVVVVGLVALIAAVVTALVITLKNKMKSTATGASNDVSAEVDKAKSESAASIK